MLANCHVCSECRFSICGMAQCITKTSYLCGYSRFTSACVRMLAAQPGVRPKGPWLVACWGRCLPEGTWSWQTTWTWIRGSVQRTWKGNLQHSVCRNGAPSTSCSMAQFMIWNSVPFQPTAFSKTIPRPGAKSSTFILIDTAALKTKQPRVWHCLHSKKRAK